MFDSFDKSLIGSWREDSTDSGSSGMALSRYASWDEEPRVVCAVDSADRCRALVLLPRVAETRGHVRGYGRERRSRGFSRAALVGRLAGNRRRVFDRHRAFHAAGCISALRGNGCGLLSSPRSAGNVAHSKWRGTGGPVLLHLFVFIFRGTGAHQRGSAGSAREEDRSLRRWGML